MVLQMCLQLLLQTLVLVRFDLYNTSGWPRPPSEYSSHVEASSARISISIRRPQYTLPSVVEDRSQTGCKKN